MRLYTVHLSGRATSPDRDAVLVREGFCWPACLFTVFWALWHRMWLVALMLVLAGAGLSIGLEALGFDPLSQAAVMLGYLVLVGYSANDWRRRALKRSGLVEVGVVVGDRREAAERRYFDRMKALAAQESP